MTVTFSIIGLIVAIICAYLGYRIAAGKGRSTTLWPILCFIFPLIGLIVLLLIPPGDMPRRAY